MKPVTYHLSDQQLERLRAESERTGLTVAELIRRAVDAMYPPASVEGIEPFRYKEYVATVRAKVEKRGKSWLVVFEGECDAGGGTITFEAESIDEARKLFEWQVDRRPAVKEAIGRALAKARKEIRKR